VRVNKNGETKGRQKAVLHCLRDFDFDP